MGHVSRLIFDSRPTTEKRTERFNFLSMLQPGVTISSATVAVIVESGDDANPQNIRSGSPSISGSIVFQKFYGGVPGVVYAATCTANTSDSQILQLTGYMAVVSDA